MALKPQRHEFKTDTSYFMNEVAERGGVACISTVGSGEAYDQSQALVTYAVQPSGAQAVGVLLNDMVNIDQTRQHINWHKDEVIIGGKVTLLNQGFVVTNWIDGAATPAANDWAYCGMSGFITNKPLDTGNPEASPLVGRFLSAQDSEGYAKVEVNLPMPSVGGDKTETQN